MEKKEVDEILIAVKKLKKKMPRKWLWITPRTEEEKEQLEKNSEFLRRLDNIAFALYEVETAYECLKRFNSEELSEEAEAVFDCMKKLYLTLGDLLRTVQ